VRETEGERLLLVKIPTRPVKRRVYGLKHSVSLRTAPAFSLGDYENSDVIAGASYIVHSLPDKRPIPLDQPSKTPPGFRRIGHRHKKKKKKKRKESIP